MIPSWNGDGEPENLEAAAEDAAEWLKLFTTIKRNDKLLLSPSALTKVRACIGEIEKKVKASNAQG